MLPGLVNYNFKILIANIIIVPPVAHACNPSYSGDRDQEDPGLKSALANSSQDPFSTKPFTRKGW
jgi:hypothetical protein